MSTLEKVLFTWSGGKDSALSLYEQRKSNDYEVAALLTSVTEDYDRISMHGVRRILLEQQAKSLGLPLEILYITRNSSNVEYEAKMKDKLLQYKNQGISSVVFGDIFLEDIRKYREWMAFQIGLKCIFPLWKRDTYELANTFINAGFKAVITTLGFDTSTRPHALDNLPVCVPALQQSKGLLYSSPCR